MALNLVTTGANLALENLVNKTAPVDLTLRLYQNNATISNALVIGAGIVEATFTGYSAIALTAAAWNAAASGSIATAAVKEFTSSIGSQSQTIYGYYLTNAAGTVLYWIEAFAGGPYTIVNNGDKIQVTPTITAD
jgi:hypothetical protein